MTKSFKQHLVFGVIAFILGMMVAYAGFGTEPIKPTQDIKDFRVTLNFVNPRDITTKCNELGTKYDSSACNAFHKPENWCDIYVPPPRWVDDTDRNATIGHEIMHCRYGEYHQ